MEVAVPKYGGRRYGYGRPGRRRPTARSMVPRGWSAGCPYPTDIQSVEFDPSGKTLATSAADGTARLLDVASLSEIGRALPGPARISVGVRSRREPPRRPLRVRHRLGLGRESRSLEGAGLRGSWPLPDPGPVGGAATKPKLPARLPADAGCLNARRGRPGLVSLAWCRCRTARWQRAPEGGHLGSRLP